MSLSHWRPREADGYRYPPERSSTPGCVSKEAAIRRRAAFSEGRSAFGGDRLQRPIRPVGAGLQAAARGFEVAVGLVEALDDVVRSLVLVTFACVERGAV
jgi:hypothetical protein